jgi:hypothetical protein
MRVGCLAQHGIGRHACHQAPSKGGVGTAQALQAWTAELATNLQGWLGMRGVRRHPCQVHPTVARAVIGRGRGVHLDDARHKQRSIEGQMCEVVAV